MGKNSKSNAVAGRTASAKAVPSPRVSESRLVLECCSLERERGKGLYAKAKNRGLGVC